MVGRLAGWLAAMRCISVRPWVRRVNRRRTTGKGSRSDASISVGRPTDRQTAPGPRGPSPTLESGSRVRDLPRSVCSVNVCLDDRLSPASTRFVSFGSFRWSQAVKRIPREAAVDRRCSRRTLRLVTEGSARSASRLGRQSSTVAA